MQIPGAACNDLEKACSDPGHACRYLDQACRDLEVGPQSHGEVFRGGLQRHFKAFRDREQAYRYMEQHIELIRPGGGL